MLDMNVDGDTHLTLSTTYTTTVGNASERLSVMIAPEALQVNSSIWPGVSTTKSLQKGAMYLFLGEAVAFP